MYIREARITDIKKIIALTMQYRQELYPMLTDDKIPSDLSNFENIYLQNQASTFLIAIENKQIVGTIGCLPYDNRFIDLNYSKSRTTEVVRLFVDKQYRRQKIASKLFNHLLDIILHYNYQIIYLHTHPFLRGAVEFWQKEHFSTVFLDNNQVLPTIHMHRKL